MIGRIIVLVSLLALLGMFAVFFKLTIPTLIDISIVDAAEDLTSTRVQRLYNLMSLKDKELISKLPCKNKQNCAEADVVKGKLYDAINGGAIIGSTILNKNGLMLFKNETISGKFEPLTKKIRESKNASNSIEFMRYNNNDVEKLIAVSIDLGKVTNDIYLEKIYLVSTVKSSEITPSPMPYYIFSLAGFFIPLGLIFLIFIRRENSFSTEIGHTEFEKETYENEIERLKKENVQQSQFLANFTHELRTPLNSVIGFSGLLKDETLGPLGNPEYIKYSDDINSSGIHLLSLINDILDYSKAEVGRLQVNISETDVIKIIKQCFAIVSPRASESGVELLQSFSSDHCILKVDSKRFKQIILNLLSNSVKFTPKGGSVTVSIFPDIKGERMYVEVKDTGVGIEERDIPTVMSLFGQVETDLNRKYEGTGIGLPFAKKLTSLMAGTFELSSKVGLGTRITLGFTYDKKMNSEFSEKYKK